MLKLLNFSCSRCSFPSDHSGHFLVNINIRATRCRSFECGGVRTRSIRSRVSPATTARKLPKSTWQAPPRARGGPRRRQTRGIAAVRRRSASPSSRTPRSRAHRRAGVDPPGGVALLARRPQARLEHGLHPRLAPGEGGPRPRRGRRRGGRHVLHVGVLRLRVAAHAEHPRDLRPRHASGVHRPYIIHNVQGHGHLLHPSRAGSAKSPPREHHTPGAAPPGPRRRGPRAHSAQFSMTRDAQKAATIRNTS